MEPPSDETLVSRCLRGDKASFGILVDRYQRIMYNVAIRVVRRREDAEDVVQSAFIKAYENLERFDPKYRFYSWLYRIAMNEALNAARKENRTTPFTEREEALDEDPESELRKNETSRHVETALMELSPSDRAIILLKHFEGFSYEEIAYIFEIRPKTVKSRLYTARQRLKDVLTTSGYLT